MRVPTCALRDERPSPSDLKLYELITCFMIKKVLPHRPLKAALCTQSATATDSLMGEGIPAADAQLLEAGQ